MQTPIILSNNRIHLELNNNANISSLRLYDQIWSISPIPIYSSVLTEPSKINPQIHHLKTHKIQIIKHDQYSATYEIEYIHERNRVLLQFEVHILADHILFKYKVLECESNCRYGLTIPFSESSEILFNNEKCVHSVINFIRHWERKWSTQDYVEVPIATIKNQSNFHIVTPLDYNVQFFKYMDENCPCLKISTYSDESKCLEIRFGRLNSEPRDAYVYFYPNLEHFISNSDNLVHEIYNQHGIYVHFTQAPNENNHNGRVISCVPHGSKYTGTWINLISDELKKYPIRLSEIGIREIVLVNHLLCQNSCANACIAGSVESRSVLLNTDISKNIVRRSLHHEIWHQILACSGKEIYLKTDWSKIFPHLTDNTHAEGLANLYGYMCTEHQYIENLDTTHNLSEELKTINDIYTSVFNGYRLRWKLDKPCADAFTVPKFTKPSTVIAPTKKFEHIWLLNSPHSGLKLLCKYLKHLDNVYWIQNWDDLFNLKSNRVLLFGSDNYQSESFQYWYNLLGGKVLWLTRHPSLIVQSVLTQNTNCDTVEYYNKWGEWNSGIFNYVPSKQRLTIKYEDIVLDDKSMIRSISEFLGWDLFCPESYVDYSKIESQYIEHDSGDFFRKYNQVLSHLEYRRKF